MRKIMMLLSSAAIMTIIGLTVLLSSNKADADNGECMARMSEETAAYIRNANIPLKGRDAEFYGSNKEQVYLLNSEETLKLNSGPVKNTVAVINRKDANGRSSFYVIEQEITPERINFVLKQDSKVLQSLPVKLVMPPRPNRLAQTGPGSCNCASINANSAALLNALLAEANRTCRTLGICLPYCQCVNGKQYLALTLYSIKPTNWRCQEFLGVEIRSQEAYLWRQFSDGPLLSQAFEIAIKKAAKHYTF